MTSLLGDIFTPSYSNEQKKQLLNLKKPQFIFGNFYPRPAGSTATSKRQI